MLVPSFIYSLCVACDGSLNTHKDSEEVNNDKSDSSNWIAQILLFHSCRSHVSIISVLAQAAWKQEFTLIFFSPCIASSSVLWKIQFKVKIKFELFN